LTWTAKATTARAERGVIEEGNIQLSTFNIETPSPYMRGEPFDVGR